jgi:hypothetical protein
MSHLGRRWQHSSRRDRALDRARRLYEMLPEFDNEEAVYLYYVLIDIIDAWGFTLSGEVFVPMRHVVTPRRGDDAR